VPARLVWLAILVKPFRESDLTPSIEVAWPRFSEFRTMEREVNSLQDAPGNPQSGRSGQRNLDGHPGLNETDAFRKIQKMNMNNRKADARQWPRPSSWPIRPASSSQ
jgi:response regulator NasT